jgi:hypothetical protein
MVLWGEAHLAEEIGWASEQRNLIELTIAK